jgi:hypothetical protein
MPIFNGIENIKGHKINSRNFTYGGNIKRFKEFLRNK